MSWSLRLHNGDLAVNGASYSTVFNEQKLVQDLRCALLEPMGTDDMHSDFGSTIDDGVLPDGTVPQRAIPQNAQRAANIVSAEIQRIARDYQTQQLNRAKNDRATYNRVSLTPGEALIAITGLQVIQQQDTLFVTVELQTATGQDITAVFPITTS